MRARRVCQGQFLAHNWPQRPIFEARKEPGVDVRLFGRCNGPERERPNRSAAPHQLTGIDGDLAATADHDDAAIVGKVLPLAEAARAHEEILEPGAAGKIVLIS